MEITKPQAQAKSRKTEARFLHSLTEDVTPLRGRIAILCLPPDESPQIIDKTILAIEYCQCITSAITSSSQRYPHDSSEPISIIRLALPVAQLFSPASLLPFTEGDIGLIVALNIAITLKLILSVIFLSYIVYMAAKRKPVQKHLLIIWKTFFKLQGRVLFYPIASIWMKTAQALLEDSFTVEGQTKRFWIVICFMMFIFEFIFSLLLQTQFTSTLPNKSLLCSKDNKIEIITLTQKGLNQLLKRILLFHPQVSIWVCCTVTALLSIIRLKYHFSFLTPYRMDSLYFQTPFLVSILCMTLLCVLQIPLHSFTADMNFVTIVWIILTILTTIVSNSYLKNRILNLVLQNPHIGRNECPEVLAHKIITTKYFFKASLHKCPEANLVRKTLKERILESYSLDVSTTTVPDLSNKKIKNEFFSKYLESILQKYPKNDFLKLYTAYFYAKKLQIYGLSFKLLAELRNSASWKIIASTSILYNDIQNKLINDYENNLFALNLNEFITSETILSKTRVHMMQQANLQTKLCQSISEPSPNLSLIQQLGKQIIQIKKDIEISRKRELTPDYSLELLLIYAYYYLAVNHSYEDYQNYKDLYIKRSKKYQKLRASKEFIQENLYTNDVGFLIYSGQRETSGKILYCGGNYQEIFGRNLNGEHLSLIATPILRPHIRLFLKGLFEQGISPLLNKKIPRFLYNANGYMTQCNWYININPFSSQGITYCVIYKTLKTHKEFILVNENGGVECFTKKISDQLNLLDLKASEVDDERDIGYICPELERVVHAFNMIAYPQRNPRKFSKKGDRSNTVESSRSCHFKNKGQNSFATYKEEILLSQEEAQSLYKQYSEEGQVLIFERFDKNYLPRSSPKRYAYRCKIMNIMAGKGPYLKEITLEKVDIQPLRKPSQDATPIKPEIRHETSDEEDDLDELRTRDERPREWIDMNKLFTTIANPDFNHRPLISTPGSSARLLLTPKYAEKTGSHLDSPKLLSPRSNFHESGFSGRLEGLVIEDCESQLQSQSAVHKPKFSLEIGWLTKHKIQVSKAFEQAVSLPFSPFLHRITTGILYLIVMTILILHFFLGAQAYSAFNSLSAKKTFLKGGKNSGVFILFLKQKEIGKLKFGDINIDIFCPQGVSQLQTSKEILLTAQTRNHYLIDLYGVLQFYLGYAQGKYTMDELGPSMGLDQFGVYTLNSIRSLASANLDLLTTADSVISTQRENLFDKDVRVFETDFDEPVQIFSNFTNFLAVNAIVEASLKGMSFMATNPTAAVSPLKFVIRNLMNDVLEKDISIATIFLASLQDKKQEAISGVFMNCGIFCGLIIATGIQFIFVIISQYKQTVENLQGLTKLNTQAIHSITKTLQSFENALKENMSLEDAPALSLPRNYMETTSNNKKAKKHAQDTEQMTSNTFGLRKKLFFLALKGLPILFSLLAIIMTFSFTVRGVFLDLGDTANKIFFINKLDSRIALIRHNLFEIAATNNTALVKGQLISEAIEDELEGAQDLKNDLISTFKNNKNSLIQKIVYDDACQFFGQQQEACKTMGNNLESVSLVNLVSNIAATFSEYFTTFEQMDKTEENLKDFQLQTFQQVISPIFRVMQPLNFEISDILDKSFEDDFSKAKAINVAAIVVIALSLIIGCLLAKIVLIDRLTREETEFRQMLMIFPANVVLSNFMIKSYLIRTVKTSSSDLFRNEI